MLSAVFASATDWLEPTARNSNLLPVKANGDVRLRSPPSFGSGGSTGVPSASRSPGAVAIGSPRSSVSKIASSSAPRNIDMIAGGASLAPRRWSFAADAVAARSSPWWVSTARITAAQRNRKRRFSAGVAPGSSRFRPVSVASDQLLCLPEPLKPANGFSCSRQTSPWRRATLRSTCIVSCWWSEPTFEFSNTGAISYWPGATSLWRVLIGTPRAASSRSASSMHARTRSGIEPK